MSSSSMETASSRLAEATARSHITQTLRESRVWDVIVIGGGATGLGTALESVTRGYKTLLLEKYDFAKGTSSRSTKLAHGGVRYLAQGNVKLVREALKERGLMRRNAPHLVKDLSFVVPGYAWWDQLYYGAGLKLYDLLSGRLSLGHSRFLSDRDITERASTINQKGLRGGILYHDGQFDDARLAIALMQTFIEQGGYALNYAPVVGLLKENSKVSGVRVRDEETQETFELNGKVIINATGIFVDAVRRMDEPAAKDMLAPSQGIHVVVDKKFLPGDSAIMIPKTSDGRVLFAVPWHDRVVIGTTDTPVDHPEYEPRPLQEEIDFILNTAVDYLDPAPAREDVLSVFVGQRPLVKEEGADSTAEISREHAIRTSDSGLITVTGGKWTTYRKMGEDVINRVTKESNLPARESVTEHLKLHGWTTDSSTLSIDAYGIDIEEVQQMEGADQRLHSRLPYTEAEVRWAARNEMARTVEDVLARRTRSLLLDAAASIEAAPRVAEILASELSRDNSWQHQQVNAYTALAQGYLLNAVSGEESREEPKAVEQQPVKKIVEKATVNKSADTSTAVKRVDSSNYTKS